MNELFGIDSINKDGSLSIFSYMEGAEESTWRVAIVKGQDTVIDRNFNEKTLQELLPLGLYNNIHEIWNKTN